MRPVQKWAPGETAPQTGEVVLAQYHPHGKAATVLMNNLGEYCSYCEVFSSDLEVEHVVPQKQDPNRRHDWDNLLLSCRRCNGLDNKGATPVELQDVYLPHLNNTFKIFQYGPFGYVGIHPGLLDHPTAKDKAERLMELVKLDKYQGSPRYVKGFPARDKRWKHRAEAWTMAEVKRQKFESGEMNAMAVAEFALQRGFFSVWYTVFENHPEAKRELVAAFQGTARDCFDPNDRWIPVDRRPGSAELR
jgi:uncharacterized protein (TIGR02646 family)